MSDFDLIIASLEQQRAAIERALEALRGVSGTSAPATKKRGRPPGKKTGGRRILSPTGPAAKEHGGLTAAGRKRLSDAMKARWASKNAPRKVARAK